MKPNLSKIINLLSTQGHQQYGGEAVTQLEHALQCATLAEAAGASEEMITACLFHDLGHLLHNWGEDVADRGIDSRHEYLALGWLRSLFSPQVTEPIRLHVEAKRYLCATDLSYYDSLSPASQQSLELQGGIFSTKEAKEFINLSFAEDALQLRKWDEQAKVPNLQTPTLTHFMQISAKVATG